MKSGNISSALKLMLFSVSILITCVVVFVAITASKEAKKISDVLIGQLNEFNHDIADSGLMKYHGAEVYGSEVTNCIKANLGDYTVPDISPVYIYVKTSSTENTYHNNTYVKNIRQFTDLQHYIKPTATFVGEVIKNTNGVIVGIKFVQK